MAQAAENSPERAAPAVGESGSGRPFQPGKSGNPGGRPKGLARKARELCGDDGETVLLYLSSIYANPREKTADRIAAAKIVLERGWGKAPMFVPVEDSDPLGLSDDQVDSVAVEFEKRIDEIAAKRKQRDSGKPKRKAS